MQRATVYRRKGQLLIVTDSQARSGVWFAMGTPIGVSGDAPLGVKGAGVRRAVSASRSGVPGPRDPDAVGAPILAWAGARTWGEFMRGTDLCAVKLDEAGYRFEPFQNLGPRQGHGPIAGRDVLVGPGASDEELGAALEEVLGRCREA